MKEWSEKDLGQTNLPTSMQLLWVLPDAEGAV
jgi:hypothetical protein